MLSWSEALELVDLESRQMIKERLSFSRLDQPRQTSICVYSYLSYFNSLLMSVLFCF